MSEPIRGRVAQVLNSREITLTVGAFDGVMEGMYFDVMDPEGEDITDPDSDEVLASIERPKVRVQIIRVQDRLSVASIYTRTIKNVGRAISDAGLLSRLLVLLGWVKTEEKIRKGLAAEESNVKIGDPVLQVVE